MSLGIAADLLAPPLCASCGRHAARGTAPLCAECRALLSWFPAEPVALSGVRVWAPLAYDGPARALVGGLKFRGRRAFARPMAAPMAAAAPASLLAHGVLVPVPLHPARRRKRGYNQAEELARELGSRLPMPVHDCLERAGGRSTQVGRGRSERVGGVRGQVRLRPGAIAPRRAVLVDDVVTTGSTLAACASALRRAGSVRVTAVAYARARGR